MAMMERILKGEIARLSRREARKTASPLKRRVVELGGMLTRKSRAMAELEKRVVQLERLTRQLLPRRIAVPLEEAKKARISPRLIKAQRKRLKLNQENFARLLSVSVAAVRSWEQGRTAPRGENLAAFVAVRGLKKTAAYSRLGITPKRKKRSRRAKKG